MTDVLAADVSWDLSELTNSAGTEGVASLLDQADLRVVVLLPFRGKLAEISATEFASAMRELEAIHDLVGRAGSRAHLEYSTDVADPVRGALMASVQERSMAIHTQLIFLELEWAALSDEKAEELVNDPALSFCQHYLRVARLARPYLLSESEERILAEKSVSGTNAWTRLFDEQVAAVRVDLSDRTVGLDEALSLTANPDRAKRIEAAAAITAGLDSGLRTRAYIYNVLLTDKATDDRLRSYQSWVSSRNLANQASDQSVKALVDAVTSRNDIPQRWYRLKAKLMGLDQLMFYDRNASLDMSGDEEKIPWEDAKSIVLDSFESFSSELASGARRFFDERWIDAPLRPSKQGGAFCSPTVPSTHPYVLVNYTGTRRDVLTLAHELGHGVHFLMSGRQSVFEHQVPLTVAETASVFGETVTFGRLLDAESDAKKRLSLLAENVDAQIATIFRQVAMWRFEDAAHQKRRTDGELSVDMFNDLWIRTQNELFGGTVNTTGYESWWSYVHHFVHVPGYVYAYAFGNLLALSVYERSQHAGSAFVPQYLEMLAAGGSKSPEGLASMVGCDLTDPEFWTAGLALVDRTLAQAEEAAAIVGSL